MSDRLSARLSQAAGRQRNADWTTCGGRLARGRRDGSHRRYARKVVDNTVGITQSVA
jgi:hypothetical protein